MHDGVEPEKRDLTWKRCPVTAEEVRCSMQRLGNRKACGPDGVPGELIKYGSRKMVQEMVHIVGRIWSEGVRPAGMKKPK